MRLSFLFAGLLAPALSFSACHSLEESRLFATAHDARVFNPQTGRFEWPADSPPSPPRVSLHDEELAAAAKRGLLNSGDERVFNPQTGRYEWPQN